jgi:hypothetical protein
VVGKVLHGTTKGEINMTDKPDANEAAEQIDTPVAYAAARGPIDNLQFLAAAINREAVEDYDGWRDARVIPLYDRAPTGEGDIASQARAWRRTSEALKEIGMLSHVESFMAATGGDRVLSFIKHLGQQSAELAELRAKLAKYDDATLVDEAWLRSIGFRTNTGEEDYLWLAADLCQCDVQWWPSRKGVSLSNQNKSFRLRSIATRGQLRHLLDGLGVRA